MSEEPANQPRKEIARENREAILDAAEHLLRRGEALSFSAVASGAGLSRPTVYSHFADRRSLLTALVDRALEDARLAIATARPAEGRPVDAMERVLRESWEHLARHQEIARVAMGSVAPESLQAAHRGVVEVIGDVVRRGRAEGSFRSDQPVEWIESSCLALIHNAVIMVRSGRMVPESALKALIVSVVDLCVGAIGGRKRLGAGHRRSKLSTTN